MGIRNIVPMVAFLTTMGSLAEDETFVFRLDDAARNDVSAWQISMSPDYYRGEGTAKESVSVIQDPERGSVLCAPFGFGNPVQSEPVFITRLLNPTPPRLDVLAVRFSCKLTAPLIDPEKGFILRLRTSEKQHDNWNVQELLGGPMPVGRWVDVEVPTVPDNKVRNIWGAVFGKARKLTFRLDDIDTKNGSGELLLDNIQLVLKRAPESKVYIPTVSPRPENAQPRMLLIRHSAAGFYGIKEAFSAVYPDGFVDTLLFRGLHFELFGFPDGREKVLAYDVIVFLDVDPFVLSPKQCHWLADAVVSGARLIVFGGQSTLTDAKEFPRELKDLFPVDFALDGGSSQSNAEPVCGLPHALNRGLSPSGLGTVGRMQKLSVKPGSEVAWSSSGLPLVVTAGSGRGSVAVINAQVEVGRGRKSFLRGTLADDFLRSLIRWVVSPEPFAGIDGMSLPAEGAPGDRFQFTIQAKGARVEDIGGRIGEKALTVAQIAPDTFRFEGIHPDTGRCTERRLIRVERIVDGAVSDWRDFELVTAAPVDMDVRWSHNSDAFAPGSEMALTCRLSPKGLPAVSPGVRTTVSFEDRWNISLDSLGDVWVMKDGAVYHDQAGPADVSVLSVDSEGFPRWSVRGTIRAMRPKDGTSFGEDGRVAQVLRTISVRPSGAVLVQNHYEFLNDCSVHRLPLTFTLPTTAYAGVQYEISRQGFSERGTLPKEFDKGTLCKDIDGELTFLVPEHPMTVRAKTPGTRMWLRDLRQYGMDCYRLEIEAPCTGKQMAKESAYDLDMEIQGHAMETEAFDWTVPVVCTAVVVDPRTGFRWSLPVDSAEPLATHFAGIMPNLASGEYILRVEARSGERSLVWDEFPCFVVDPLGAGPSFPIMSIVGLQGGGHYLDRLGIQERIDDLVDHGFNTLSSVKPGDCSGVLGQTAELRRFASDYAQSLGLNVFFEYTNFTTYTRRRAFSPCPFSPDLQEATEKKLKPLIAAGTHIPRLITAKVVDEPYVTPKSLDMCEHCQNTFRQKYGLDLKVMSMEDPPFARWAYAEFASEAVDRVFAAGAEVMAGEKPPFDLLLTYMCTGLGYQSPLKTLQDAHRWSRNVSWADFDVYPYFYPKSQRIRMIQAGFAMSAMNDIGRHRGIPWGFYVELDDRNWPFQKNPVEATAECAFTAVAYGAGYLNSFIHRAFGTGTQARPERWEAAGEALRLINRCGPLLAHMSQPRANVAILYPDTHEAIENGFDQPDYLLAMLKGSFGDVDIYRERSLLEKGSIPYPVLFVLRTNWLHEDAVPVLKSWLTGGGTLLCDHLPGRTHRDSQIEWNVPVTHGANSGHGLVAREVKTGKGTVVLLDRDIDAELEKLCEDNVLRQDAVRERRLRLRDLVDQYAAPNIRVEYQEGAESVDTVEVGMREAAGAVLVTLVNHQPEPRDVTVLIYRPGVNWWVDMATLEPVVSEEVAWNTVALRLTIPGRWGRILTGYTKKPKRASIRLSARKVGHGEMLEYEIQAKRSFFSTFQGSLLVKARVTDSDGTEMTRFGGNRVMENGKAVFTSSIPINLPKGRYRIEAVLPQIQYRTGAAFEVR